jgi:hypothetical protein
MLSQLLGYAKTGNFVRPEQLELLPASEIVYTLRTATHACEEMSGADAPVRFDGAYLLSEDKKTASIPVIYVISADSDSDARRVHQFVWNQNQVPFLLLESPSTVRLYSGFSYDHEADMPLVSVARDAADLLTRLDAFRAEAIDDGSIWKQWAHSINPQRRVDESLLRDLATLDRRLQTHDGIDRGASHGLIGRYVYLNYLRDRKILSDKKLARWGIDPQQLFSKDATLKAFRRTNEELQKWLNGSVFSLGDDDLSAISADQLKLVARVFAGDSPVGMTDIQTALFSVYDFSHIPIETLSCVYEQFLHDSKGTAGPSRGKTLGAYYTPLPLTDYVLTEMERKRPLEPGIKVLDPSCGSGAFLVQCYRRLIEQQRRSLGRELKATELRELLTQHIFGIDHDDDACRVAELSLIMTLLDYIAPPDLENTKFKLPTLRNKNIFQGDFFDIEGAAFEFLAEQSFDWIVGNPPWAEVKGTPSADHEHYVAHQWMRANIKTHPTSGNQLAEAFLWKSGEHLAKDGVCGLVVLAMTWFKKEATTFRQRFFSERSVWCLANFANLAYVLFSGSERPASVVFFENTKPIDDHTILTFAPFVAEQIANRPERASKRLMTWNIVVGADELREIDQEDAVKGDSLTWKLAMWGTSRDRKLLAKLDARFRNQTIQHLGELGIGSPHEGLQLRSSDAAEELEHHPELVGKKKLLIDTLRGVGRIYDFPEHAIGRIDEDECYVRKGRSAIPISISSPPHIIIDASRRFAVYHDEFIAVPPRHVGIKGTSASNNYLRALSLFLSSDFCTYHQFLLSPQWGIDASRADLNALKMLPAPLQRLGVDELQEWSDLLLRLRASLNTDQLALDGSVETEQTPDLLCELNARVYKLLGLRQTEQWLIEDFVELHMQLNKGKLTSDVLRKPTSTEQLVYLKSLRDCLDSFLPKDQEAKHRLELLTDRESALLSVSLSQSKTRLEPVLIAADDQASRDLKTVRDRLLTRHSQWIYFNRKLKAYDPKLGKLYQFKPLERLHWTRRQAVLDADDIIAETLVEAANA